MEERELISLKVMRLCQPMTQSHNAQPLKWALEDMLSPFDDDGATDQTTFDASKTQSLLLPTVLGSVYQGESFHAFVHLSNICEEGLGNVSLQIELSCESERYVLFNNMQTPITNLAPHDSFSQSILRPLTDVGQYMWVVNTQVSHATVPPVQNSRLGEQRIKREYKFTVLAPLAISHRVQYLPDYCLVEIALENVAKINILLREALVTCVEGIVSHRLDSASHDTAQRSLKGLCYLKHGDPDSKDPTVPCRPGDRFNLLFSFHPSSAGSPNRVSVKQLPLLGHLKLIWSSPSCDEASIGNYELTAIPVKVPPVELRVVSCPVSVTTEAGFPVTFELANLQPDSVDCLLALDHDLMNPFHIQGAGSTHEAGRLEPYSSKNVTLYFVVTQPGIHSLKGIAIQNAARQLLYASQSLCEIIAF